METQFYLSLLRQYQYEPYETSARKLDGTLYVMACHEDAHFFIVAGQDDSLFHGEFLGTGHNDIKVCALSHENRLALQKRFPYTVPVSMNGHDVTLGLGDRLGICSIAHIAALKNTDVFPVLGQQSKRELSLTGRTVESMIDDVAWQVFCAGYEDGYAVDGDHLKTLEDVLEAVGFGATMITLDCSDAIDNTAHTLSCNAAKACCRQIIAADLLQFWEERYMGKTFFVKDGVQIIFEETAFWQLLLTYGKAVFFAKEVYEKAIQPCNHEVSFEISLDETETTTDPAAHYFVAAELQRLGVATASIAPRFYGEFQKGVDYMGELDRFETEFCAHAAVAEFFGHRISVHSGSDKFSVFSIVGKYSCMRFHLKTSGTSWVEAVRMIAICAPQLFRRMVDFSCKHFEEARTYYHVSASASRVPDVSVIADEDLPALLDDIDTRQVMHITYGFLLQSRADGGRFLFRDDIYRVLQEHKSEFDQLICNHIRKHLAFLGVI